MRDTFKVCQVDIKKEIAARVDIFAQNNNLSRAQATNLILHFCIDQFIRGWEQYRNDVKELLIQSMESYERDRVAQVEK